jgi:hypothetical protein
MESRIYQEIKFQYWKTNNNRREQTPKKKTGNTYTQSKTGDELGCSKMVSNS